MPFRNIAIFAKKCNQKTITNILKRLQELLIKRYGQFNFSQKSESIKFKSGIRPGKGLRKIMTGKACELLRKIMTFAKKCNQKSMISAAKTQNTHKLQKCPQKAFWSLVSRDKSNLSFSQNSQKIANLRAISPRERCKVFFLRRRRLTPSETW